MLSSSGQSSIGATKKMAEDTILRLRNPKGRDDPRADCGEPARPKAFEEASG